MKDIKKLYRAGSVVYGSNGNDGISVTWYNADNKMFPLNYEDIIKNYSAMPLKEKMAAARYVNEFFTSDQIELLRQFVKKEFGAEVVVEEHLLPIEAQGIDKDNDEVLFLGFGEVEGLEGNNIIQLDKLETYDLPFKVKGIYRHNDSRSSNELLDKLKTDYVSHNERINRILPSGQFDKEIMIDRFLGALAAGRVHFVTVNSLDELGIGNMEKITIH
jgi:hypothetical protein